MPAATTVPQSFGGAGSMSLAAVTLGGAASVLSWTARLPKPVLDGATATYPDVAPGVDLKVTASTLGYETFLMVKSRPAKPIGTVSLLLRGLAASQDATTGQVTLRNAKGEVVAGIAPPRMWDASDDPISGLPRTAALPSVLRTVGGVQRPELSVPDAFLADPATVFPVTVDPAMTVSRSSFAYVDSTYPTQSYFNDNWDSSRVHVGTYNGGGSKNRAFFTFNSTGFKGKHIVSATLNTVQSWSYNCTATPVEAWRTGAISASTTWNAQPAWSAKLTTVNAAHGNGCPAAGVAFGVTSGLQSIASASGAAFTVGLKAVSETDNTQWKKFNTTPTMSVTYNSYPGAPGGRGVTPYSSVCYNPEVTNSTSPKLTASTTDADGGTLRYDYEVWAGNSASPTTRTTYGSVSSVPSGATAAWTVPAGRLANYGTYEYRVRAFDGTDYGPWSSGWVVFTIDATAPNAPTVSSTTWPADTWSAATSGTVSWTDASTDVATYAYKLDAGTWSAATTAKSVALSGLASNVEHTVSVQAKDKAGNVSAAATYAFGVGTGGVTSPKDQDRTQARVTLDAKGPAAETYAGYQWRRGTTAAWGAVPVADVTTPGTTTHPAKWPAAIGAMWTWNLASTAGNVDGLIQVRACLYTSATDTTPTCQGSGATSPWPRTPSVTPTPPTRSARVRCRCSPATTRCRRATCPCPPTRAA